MGVPVILYGKSGSGKSRSLKNFAKDEIVFVNVERKLLPFRSKFEYELKSDDVATIKKSGLVTKLIRLKERSFYDVVNMKFKIGRGD